MSKWKIEYYTTRSDHCPAEEFLDSLTNEEFARLNSKILLLQELGINLRRPHVGFLRDKIYELRARDRKKQLRILYFFFDGNKIIFSHGIVKKLERVPDAEIARAIMHYEDYIKQQKEKKR